MIVKKQRIVFSYILLEFILLNICALSAFYFKTPIVFASEWSKGLFNEFFPLLLIFNISWLLIVFYNGTQDLYVSYSLKKRVKYLIINAFLLVGLTSTLFNVLKVDFFNRTYLLAPVLLFSISNLFSFLILNQFFKRKKGKSPFGSRLLVLGAGSKGREVLDFTNKNKHLGYGIVGFLDDETPAISQTGVNVLGKLQDLPNVLDSRPVDEIVITLPSQEEVQIKKAIEIADYRGIRVNVVPETPLWMGANYKSYTLDSLPVYQLRQTALDNFNNFLLKKSFDMVFALCVLIFLSPVFLLIALLVKLESPGPIFYKPRRKGQAGGSFTCYKFRTMKVCDDPLNGTKSTVKNDPRITRIGKYLRKFDLDELPQFFNVLKGDMSVVGPRPHRTNLKSDFRKIVNDYMVRHYVKPGITGWAQVNGWRGPTETVEQKKERVTHDLWYIENWSFLLDIKIIFLTVFSRKTRKNAF